jgi:hypothetical protein
MGSSSKQASTADMYSDTACQAVADNMSAVEACLELLPIWLFSGEWLWMVGSASRLQKGTNKHMHAG